MQSRQEIRETDASPVVYFPLSTSLSLSFSLPLFYQLRMPLKSSKSLPKKKYNIR